MILDVVFLVLNFEILILKRGMVVKHFNARELASKVKKECLEGLIYFFTWDVGLTAYFFCCSFADYHCVFWNIVNILLIGILYFNRALSTKHLQ